MEHGALNDTEYLMQQCIVIPSTSTPVSSSCSSAQSYLAPPTAAFKLQSTS